MSVTFLMISCTSCSFRGSSLVTAGRYLWRHKDQTCNIYRRLGLCLDCKKVVAIEDFPDSETMQRARNIRKTYTGEPLNKFFEPDYAKFLASRQGFDVLEHVVALGRRPVCLVCGNSAIRPIVMPKGASGDTPVSLNLGHPWCAGKLQVQNSGGMRISLSYVTRIYDIQGGFISEYKE